MYTDLESADLKALKTRLDDEYAHIKARGLALNMARGKPAADQPDLSMPLLTTVTGIDDCFSEDGTDCRNYGVLDGIPEAKRLMAGMLDDKPENVIVGGASSLTLMYNAVSRYVAHGALGSTPWGKLDNVKWLCPVPGYDRHFLVTESFGFELIPVPMNEDGPDMDFVEQAVANDASVKGIWCVPKYSNPDGIVYSDEVIDRIAHLKPAAADFLLMWDNAYCIHEFDGEFRPFRDILTLCSEAGNPDMVFEFASTSKITFPGSGVACFACSEANMAYMKKLISAQTISFDKINQLRHALFLKDRATALAHMKKHAEFLKPKFDIVLEYLEREIKPLDIGRWHTPKGGYFVSFFTIPGCAKRTNQLAKEAGVVMTAAGATYPYGIDPEDSNLRIAPSYPPVEELKEAMSVFCTCVKLAAAEKLLAEK